MFRSRRPTSRLPRLRAPDDARARGSRAASSRSRRSTNEQAELIFRKGARARGGVPRSAPRRRARRSPRSRSSRPRLGAARSARRSRRCAPASTSSTRASSSTAAGAGVADFLMRVETPSDARRVELRGARHEARPHAKPAYILQLCFYNEQLARLQGREPDADPRAARLGRAGSLPAAASSAPTTGASARGSSEFVADPPQTEPYPIDHCGICDFKPLCDAHWDAVDHLSPRRRDPAAAQIDEARRRRDHDARRRSAARRPSRRRRASPPDTFDEAPRAGRAPALGARARAATAFVLLAAAAGARVRAAARPVARRPLLRLRGQPVLGQRRQPRVPLGHPRRRAQLHAALRARPRRPSGARSRRSSTSSTSGSRASPTCTSTTTRVRDHRAQAADGPLRHARGRARRPAPPRASSSTSTRSSATASAPRGPATG